MTTAPRRARDYAHVALAGIRLFNGAAALLAPGFLGRRAGVPPEANPGAPYFMRMFGIRTILIALELLLSKGQARARALNTGVVIHASDTVSAAVSGFRGELPRRSAMIATAISATNTLLAVSARRPRRAKLPWIAS